MKYLVTITIEVADEADFLNPFDAQDSAEVVADLLSDAIYDIDDLKIHTLEIEEA